MEWAIIGSCLAGAAIGFANLARLIYQAWRRVDDFLRDWTGEVRPGFPAVLSMPERVSALESRLASVESQVTPNGGNTQTLADRVVRVERAVAAHQGANE